jgi:hypothetical protein
MTNKRVEFDPHFLDDCRDRGFTKEDGLWLLERGIPFDVATYAGDTRYGREGEIRNRMARLIYLENAARVLLISIQWVLSQGAITRRKAGKGRRKGKVE